MFIFLMSCSFHSGGVKCVHRADTDIKATHVVKPLQQVMYCKMIRVPYAQEGGRARTIHGTSHNATVIRKWTRDMLKAMGNFIFTAHNSHVLLV